jgi:hypothetical protein
VPAALSSTAAPGRYFPLIDACRRLAGPGSADMASDTRRVPVNGVLAAGEGGRLLFGWD